MKDNSARAYYLGKLGPQTHFSFTDENNVG